MTRSDGFQGFAGEVATFDERALRRLQLAERGFQCRRQTVVAFSSCGPTDDNRIKPDLTIPGESVVSANNDGNVTTNNCGTEVTLTINVGG